MTKKWPQIAQVATHPFFLLVVNLKKIPIFFFEILVYTKYFFNNIIFIYLLLHTKITINQKSNKLDYTYKQKIIIIIIKY